jgi:hypothetical protein
MRHLILGACPLLLALACQPDQNLGTRNAAPDASITSHQSGEVVLEGSTVTLHGLVSDADHDAADLQVTWLAGGVTACEAASPGVDGSTSCETTLDLGEETVTLEVRDPMEASGAAIVELVIEATEAPQATILAPEEGGTYYSDQKITLEGTVGDAEDEAQDLLVWWESDLDGELDLDVEPSSDGTVSDATYLSEGEHFLSLAVLDSGGKSDSDSVVITVGPPNTAPTCTITAPESGTAGAEGETVVFQGEVSDPDIPANWLDVTWSSDKDGDLGTSSPDSGGAVAFPWDGLSVGTHVVTMAAADEVDGDCSAFVLYTVGTPPEVSLEAPVSGDLFGEGDTVTFTARVSDSEDASGDLDLSWVSNIDGVLSSSPADSTGLAQFTSGDLSAGSHTLTLTVTDSAALYAVAMVTFTVNGLPSAPAVSLTPDPATTSDDLQVALGTPSVDPEGATITYGYAWYQDGTLSSASSSATLDASATTRDESWRVVVTPSDGTHTGLAGEATITVGNSAPAITGATLGPDPASESDTLTCTPVGESDADGDVVSFVYAWLVSGVDPGTSDSTLTGSHFDRGDTVSCTITPSDGTDAGASVASNTVTIGNSAPSVTSATIGPDPAFAGDTLVCSYSGYYDGDGDPDASTIAWTVGGTAVGSGASLSYAIVGGDAVLCTVTPSDGTDTGTDVSAALLVSNSAPSLASVTISPNPAIGSDTLSCAYSGFSDPDGDADVSTVDWTINGAWAGSSTTLSGGFVRGDTVSCEATPSDGADDGSPVSDSLLIGNAPPTVSTVTLSPSAATTDDVITAGVSTSDPDGDTVTLTYAWSVDGSAVSSDTTLDGATWFDKGQVVAVTITPYDGTDSGSAVSSSGLTIDNTPPEAPGISLDPSDPEAGTDDLVCSVTTGSYDADGDGVSYSFTWTVDGADYPIDWDTGFASSGWTGPTTTTWTDDTVPAADLLAGEVWSCTVTPHDGDDDGSTASGSATVQAPVATCVSSTSSLVLAGPHTQYGLCWYLGLQGKTCDEVCSAVGGSNLASSADALWGDNCSGAESDDVSTWFYDNGNAASWASYTGSTSYHTLGYGYTGSHYYGKCSGGTSTTHGTYPGDSNGDSTRALVCPCFTE